MSSEVLDCKWFDTLDKLLEYLKSFPPETEICGIGGGSITITRYQNEPNTLWIE